MAFKANCVRQVAAGARQTDVARAQSSSRALPGRWQRQVLAEAVPNSAERAELKRVEQEHDRVNISDHPCATASGRSRYQFVEYGVATELVQALCRVLKVCATTSGYARRTD